MEFAWSARPSPISRGGRRFFVASFIFLSLFLFASTPQNTADCIDCVMRSPTSISVLHQPSTDNLCSHLQRIYFLSPILISLYIEEQKMSQIEFEEAAECDYDESPTTIYLLITRDRDWEGVKYQAENFPRE
jgi:hypothetical protein